VFMTGEGVTTPTHVTGSVTSAPYPVPLLPISALVAGQPAQVTWDSEAPGAVAGVLQVNLVIPNATPVGAQSIVISVGTNQTQSNVTVSVK